MQHRLDTKVYKMQQRLDTKVKKMQHRLDAKVYNMQHGIILSTSRKKYNLYKIMCEKTHAACGVPRSRHPNVLILESNERSQNADNNLFFISSTPFWFIHDRVCDDLEVMMCKSKYLQIGNE